jgi:hypothetical protein
VSAKPGSNTGGFDLAADSTLTDCIDYGKFPASTPAPGAR